MIALAVGLGVLGFFALRRARRCRYGGGYGYGWYGPYSGYGGDDHDGDDDDHHHRGHHRGGPPWMRHRGRGRRGRWVLHAALARIDATPAQERVIVGEIDKLRDRMHEARHGLRDANVDLAAALRGPVLDDAALGAVLGRVDGTTGDARSAAIDALRNIHAVLDEKQRAELADIIEKRDFGGWRGRGGRRGRGRGPGGAGWHRMGPYR